MYDDDIIVVTHIHHPKREAEKERERIRGNGREGRRDILNGREGDRCKGEKEPGGLKRKREEYPVKRKGGKEGERETGRESMNERREMPRQREGEWKERNGRDAADIA